MCRGCSAAELQARSDFIRSVTSPFIFLTGCQVVPASELQAPASRDKGRELRKRVSCVNVRYQILMEASFFLTRPQRAARTLTACRDT